MHDVSSKRLMSDEYPPSTKFQKRGQSAAGQEYGASSRKQYICCSSQQTKWFRARSLPDECCRCNAARTAWKKSSRFFVCWHRHNDDTIHSLPWYTREKQAEKKGVFWREMMSHHHHGQSKKRKKSTSILTIIRVRTRFDLFSQTCCSTNLMRTGPNFKRNPDSRT